MTGNITRLREAHARVMYLGLAFNLLLPMLFLLAGVGIKRMMSADAEPWGMEPDSLRILFWALLALAISEIPVVLLLRKLMLKPNMRTSEDAQLESAVTFVWSRYIVLYAVALSPSIYGLVFYLLGGSFRDFVLFGLISLLIYRLVRPSQTYFLSLFGAGPPGEG